MYSNIFMCINIGIELQNIILPNRIAFFPIIYSDTHFASNLVKSSIFKPVSSLWGMYQPLGVPALFYDI